MRLRRILIVRTDRLGDLLMNVPVFRRLRQNFPKSFITLLCSQEAAEAVRQQPDLDEVMTLGSDDLSTLTKRYQFYGRLKKLKPDGVFVLNPSKLFHVMAFALGSKVRAGFNRKWGFLLNKSIADHRGHAERPRHEINRNLALLDSICPQAWDRRLELGFEKHPSYKAILQKFGISPEKRFMVFHCQSTNPKKAWNTEWFSKAIKDLSRTLPVKIVGADTIGDTSFIRKEEAVENLVGKTTLSELAILIRHAACLVSLDSGPYHLAWMQKVPVVGLFMKEATGSNPSRWGVYPDFVEYRQIHKYRQAISPEEVIDAVRSLLRAVKV